MSDRIFISPFGRAMWRTIGFSEGLKMISPSEREDTLQHLVLALYFRVELLEAGRVSWPLI